MLDTAAAYGYAEERIGAYLRQQEALSKRIIVATKWGEEFNVATGESRYDFSRDNLQASVARSLTRLPRIDLLYIHLGSDADVLRDASVIREMVRMKQERIGGIRYLGVSVSRSKLLEEFVRDELLNEFDVVQMPATLFYKQKELVKKIYAQGKAIVVNSPVRKLSLIHI